MWWSWGFKIKMFEVVRVAWLIFAEFSSEWEDENAKIS